MKKIKLPNWPMKNSNKVAKVRRLIYIMCFISCSLLCVMRNSAQLPYTNESCYARQTNRRAYPKWTTNHEKTIPTEICFNVVVVAVVFLSFRFSLPFGCLLKVTMCISFSILDSPRNPRDQRKYNSNKNLKRFGYNVHN